MATMKAAQKQVEGVSRREFLYYLWGASTAMLAAGTCGAVAWYAQERVRIVPEIGLIQLNLASIPALGAPPKQVIKDKYVLVHNADGLVAFHVSCVFHRCAYKWVGSNDRFECPCCGGKYQIDGQVIEGPAQRSLDRFVLEVTTPDGTTNNLPSGDPINIDGATQILLHSQMVIKGKPRPITFKPFSHYGRPKN